MATAFNDCNDKICHACAPKKTVAITSCHGCDRQFCRKHFNEHRDQLSNDLNNSVDQHDEILQDLQTKIDYSSKNQLDNDDARNLLHQIDEWETRTIDACRHAAEKARATVKNLFDKTKENDALIERLSSLAAEIKEQQQVENFVEHDLDRWKKQLEELKTNINQPIETPTGILIQSKDIDWKEIIKISQVPESNKNVEHYVLVGGGQGAGL